MANLSVLVAAEIKRLRDFLQGASKTTGAGTPQSSGLLENPFHVGDAGASATVTRLNALCPQAIIEIERNGSGNGWTNLGAGGYQDVVTAEGAVIRRGINAGGPDDNVATSGTLAFSLNNSAGNSARTLGLYSPYHASKLAGWDLGIGCRVRLVDPATGTSRTRFVGRIDAIYPAPGERGVRYVRVVATDWMNDAARWLLTAGIGEQTGKTWDEILTAILAQMPVQPPGGVSIDMGSEAYPFALDSSSTSQPATAEFKKLADSERGLIYLTADGVLRGEARHARVLTTSSVWTVAEADLQGLTLPSTRTEVIDTFRVTIHPKIVDPLPTSIVYNQANVIEVGAGQTQLLLGSFRDEITGDPIGATEVQPLAGSDYTVNSARDDSGSDISADFAITVAVGQAGVNISVTNNGASTGYVTSFRLRGKAVRDKGSVQLQSPTVAGEHVYEIDMPYQANADVGQGAADYYLAKYGTLFAQVRTFSVPGKRADLLTAILQREISDRVTLSETVTGLAGDFFINGIEERLLPSGHLQATYIAAPAADPQSGRYWVPGVSVLGVDTIPAPF